MCAAATWLGGVPTAAAVAAGEAAPGYQHLLLRAVRVPGARQCALKVVVPATLLIIFVLLYLTFRRWTRRC
jgi:predicted phosphoribosyltransferase